MTVVVTQFLAPIAPPAIGTSRSAQTSQGAAVATSSRWAVSSIGLGTRPFPCEKWNDAKPCAADPCPLQHVCKSCNRLGHTKTSCRSAPAATAAPAAANRGGRPGPAGVWGISRGTGFCYLLSSSSAPLSPPLTSSLRLPLLAPMRHPISSLRFLCPLPMRQYSSFGPRRCASSFTRHHDPFRRCAFIYSMHSAWVNRLAAAPHSRPAEHYPCLRFCAPWPIFFASRRLSQSPHPRLGRPAPLLS